jgi:2-polyprenyl-3-methyl-5-hydroxy-6-metoxy-1,4-benzoquinol methylase
MGQRYRDDWSELATREPYYAVLTDRRFLRENLDDDTRREFFATGDADVAQLFATVSQIRGAAFLPQTALDFGCGVGRLTLPIARRATAAVGCDIAPQMVAEAKQNAENLGIQNATFVTSLDEISDRRFDFIGSLIVFQHIPVHEGMTTMRRLLDLLARGGTAAVHVTLHRPGSTARRVARRIRGALPFLHRIAQRLERDPLRLPYMQMNPYDESAVTQCFVDATGSPPVVIPRNDDAIEGALFIGTRT